MLFKSLHVNADSHVHLSLHNLMRCETLTTHLEVVSQTCLNPPPKAVSERWISSKKVM